MKIRAILPFVLFSIAATMGLITSATANAASFDRWAGRPQPVALQGCSGFPVITGFYANPQVISPGQVTTLYWGLVANADYAAVTTPAGTRGVGTPGTLQVNPTQTTTYTLTARCGSNQVQAQTTVVVQGGVTCSGTPGLNGLTANPPTIQVGESTNLSWGLVSNATSATLSGPQGTSGVATPGGIVVSPSQTTTYTLTGWCYNNAAQVSVTVTVTNPQPPTPPPPTNEVRQVIAERQGSGQIKVTVNYFWNGQDSPAVIQSSGYNNNQLITNQPTTGIIAGFVKYVIQTLVNSGGGGKVTSVTSCIVGRGGQELACLSGTPNPP